MGIRSLEGALATLEILYEGRDRDEGYLPRLILAADSLASLLIEAGHYDRSVAVAARTLRTIDEFAKQGLPNQNFDTVRASLLMTLSRAPFHRRNWDECLKLRNEGVRLARLALDRNPDPGLTADLAGVLAARGYLFREMGRLKDALQDYAESDALLDGIRPVGQRNLRNDWLRAKNRLEAARTLLLQAKPRAAEALLASTVAAHKLLLDESPQSVGIRRTHALSLAWLASARRQLGRPRNQWQPLFVEASNEAGFSLRRDPQNTKARAESEEIREQAAAAGVAGMTESRADTTVAPVWSCQTRTGCGAIPETMKLSRRSLLACPSFALSAPAKPNLVMILADDLGWGDLSLNGATDIATPNIDSLARQGVRFTRSYSNAPECSPARCALLTGRYQQRAGGLECAIGVGDTGRYDEAAWLQSRGELGLPPDQAVLAPALLKAGYDTALIGKWHLGYREKFLPVRQGFQHFFGILGGAADYYTHEEPNEGRGRKPLFLNDAQVERKGNLTDLFAEAALEWLGRRRGRPFFLYLPFTAPHEPLQNPAEYDPATGTAPHRPKDRKTYAALVEHLDRRVGDVLGQLQRVGAAANTLVVFHSDNGGAGTARNAPWRGAKSSVFEGGIRSPILLRWPGRLPAGAACAQPAVTMDITATLLAAAGAPAAGPRLDGIDLLPYAAGARTADGERTLFWRYKRAANRRKAVRDGRWKYVFDSGAEYLFDLEADPAEAKNLLAADPPKAAQLKSKLALWEAETASPRLRDFRPTEG